MTDTVVRLFRDNLRKLERIVEVQLRQETCCHEVSVAQCHTLLAVEALGEPTLGELAAVMGLDKSTLSRTVDGLVRSGRLRREVDSADRRAVRIALSADGKKVCEAINETNDLYYKQVLLASGRDPEELVAVFADLVKAMGETLAQGKSCATKKKGAEV